MIDVAAEAVFIAARAATDRGACEKWIKAQGIKPESPDYEAAKGRYCNFPILVNQELKTTALQALTDARRVFVDKCTPFPAMIWYGGATDTYRGYRFLGTFENFVEHVLVSRAQEVAEKRSGWVVTPTTNIDGHRVNASTLAMHALNLDCDARGSWDKVIEVLDAYSLAYIAYQSGGWSPTAQKWHLLIPLSQPFDTSTPERVLLWKSAYHQARVVFGAAGELLGEGFDPTIEAPSQPVFITERRSEGDAPRVVVWKTGYALDLPALIAVLPKAALPEQRASDPSDRPMLLAGDPLDDDRLEEIVTALCVPMSTIMTGRRDLYLCLPGALLDRGLDADDVLAIIEEISSRCPGDPSYTRTEIHDKHQEHVHCARTTISRYENGGVYTRIGTLAMRWPQVAYAIDDVLPDPALENMRALLAKWSAPKAESAAMFAAAPVPQIAASLAGASPYAINTPVSLGGLKSRLKKLRRDKLRSKNIHERIRGAIIDALLDGEDLVPYILKEDGAKELVRDSRDLPIDRDAAIYDAMRLVAQRLPLGTPFEAVIEIVRPSLYKMLTDGEKIEFLIRRAERAFVRNVGKKMDRDKTRHETGVKDRLGRCL